MGPIIPDLLVGIWHPARPPRSYAAATWIDAHVWSLIERAGTITRDGVGAQLHLSEGALVATEARLVRHGIICRVESSSPDQITWMLAPTANTTDMEIVAVEAKLARWQDAVQQAANYLAFADRAYVVLDGNRVDATDAVCAAVRAARVGLVLQHGRVLREVITAPVHTPPRTPERVLAVTKLATPRGGRAFRARRGRTRVAGAPGQGAPHLRIAPEFSVGERATT